MFRTSKLWRMNMRMPIRCWAAVVLGLPVLGGAQADATVRSTLLSLETASARYVGLLPPRWDFENQYAIGTSLALHPHSVLNGAQRSEEGVSRWKGVAIGFGIGAALGAAVYIAGRCSRFKDPLDGSCVSVGNSVAIGGLIGGAAGALIGTVAVGMRSSPALEPPG